MLFKISELFGFISGATCVFLVARQSIYNFPIGILNNIFFIIMFFYARLYGDVFLQFFYIIFSLIGFREWKYGGKNKTELKVSTISKEELLNIFFLGGIGILIATLYLKRINGFSPFLDACVLIGSLIGQYLLTKKKLESWFAWISVDIIGMYLYMKKGLYLTTLLHGIYIIICIKGLYNWRKSFEEKI